MVVVHRLMNKKFMYKILNYIIKFDHQLSDTKFWELYRINDISETSDCTFSEQLLSTSRENIAVLDTSQYSNVIVSRNGNGRLLSDSLFQNNILLANDDLERDELTLMGVYSFLTAKKALMLHSSLISTKSNQGVMFLGVSGIGKTTQAENWNKYRNAEIINGDRVFVKLCEDGLYAYGSPWHGSSPYCLNKRVPVRMMVFLEKAPENKLRKLSEVESLQALTDAAFYPQRFPEGMEKVMEVIDRLICDVPMYHLSCRPDEEAVALVEEELNNIVNP